MRPIWKAQAGILLLLLAACSTSPRPAARSAPGVAAASGSLHSACDGCRTNVAAGRHAAANGNRRAASNRDSHAGTNAYARCNAVGDGRSIRNAAPDGDTGNANTGPGRRADDCRPAPAKLG